MQEQLGPKGFKGGPPELGAVPGNVEQAAHDLAGIVQVIQGLEQGHHPLRRHTASFVTGSPLQQWQFMLLIACWCEQACMQPCCDYAACLKAAIVRDGCRAFTGGYAVAVRAQCVL